MSFLRAREPWSRDAGEDDADGHDGGDAAETTSKYTIIMIANTNAIVALVRFSRRHKHVRLGMPSRALFIAVQRAAP